MLPTPRARFSKKTQHRCILPSSSVMCLQPGSLAMARRVSAPRRKPWLPKIYSSKEDYLTFHPRQKRCRTTRPRCARLAETRTHAARAGAGAGFASPARLVMSRHGLPAMAGRAQIAPPPPAGDGDGMGMGPAAAPGETCLPLQGCRWMDVHQPTKFQPLLGMGNLALVLGKNSFLTPVSSLQSLDQEEGHGGTSLSCNDFPSQEPRHNIPGLAWPDPMNAKERAAVTPNTAVTIVIAVDGVSSSCLVSTGRKPGANPTKISSNRCRVYQQAASTAAKAVTFAGGFIQLGGI